MWISIWSLNYQLDFLSTRSGHRILQFDALFAFTFPCLVTNLRIEDSELSIFWKTRVIKNHLLKRYNLI